MGSDDSEKKTHDPVRDAVVALGKAEQKKRDEAEELAERLRHHLTAQEWEAYQTQRKAQSEWEKRPTEEEFNREWFKPLDILDVADPRLADEAEKWSLVQELQAGTIRAVARKAQISPNLLSTEHLAVIFPAAWRKMDETAEGNFWKTGHLVVYAGYGDLGGSKERYFDIRFDPQSFGPKPMLPPAPDLSPEPAQETPPERRRDLPPLSDSLLRKWHTLFVAAYPSGTVTFARRSVDGMFPDRFVSRKRLRELFPDAPVGRPKENKDLYNSPENDGE